MPEVDPRDFMDFFLIAVKPTVFSETSLTKDDIDEQQNPVIYSQNVVDDELHIEFTSKQGAEKLVEDWNRSLDAIRRGKLIIRRPHSSDKSEVDAYLTFQPRA